MLSLYLFFCLFNSTSLDIHACFSQIQLFPLLYHVCMYYILPVRQHIVNPTLLSQFIGMFVSLKYWSHAVVIFLHFVVQLFIIDKHGVLF